MKIQSPKCNHSDLVKVFDISAMETDAKCHQCRTKVLFKNDAESRNGAPLEDQKCPQCGFSNSQAESCLRCGVIFSKYHEDREKKRIISHQQNKDIQHMGPVIKHMGGPGLGSVRYWVVLIAVICMGLLSNIFIDGKNQDPTTLPNAKPALKAVHIESVRELDGEKRYQQGVLLSRGKDIPGAVKNFKLARNIFEELSDQRFMALANLKLAMCYRILNKNQVSLDYFEAALDISSKNGFMVYKAKALQGIGYVYSTLGLYEKAIINMREALDIHQLINERRDEALDWLILGTIEVNRDTNEAGDCFHRAIVISKEIGHTMIEDRALSLLKKWSSHSSKHAPLLSTL